MRRFRGKCSLSTLAFRNSFSRPPKRLKTFIRYVPLLKCLHSGQFEENVERLFIVLLKTDRRNASDRTRFHNKYVWPCKMDQQKLPTTFWNNENPIICYLRLYFNKISWTDYFVECQTKTVFARDKYTEYNDNNNYFVSCLNEIILFEKIGLQVRLGL